MDSDIDDYKPIVKRKKYVDHTIDVNPLPILPNSSGEPFFRGIYTGLSVEVTNHADMCNIYENGNYGKGSCSRGAPQVLTHQHTTEDFNHDETLVLELEEAFFLAYANKIMKIFAMDGNEMTMTQYLSRALHFNSMFVETYAAYQYFKYEGWVVKSGIKYGGHFLLYKKGVRFHHASCVVLITTPADKWHCEPQNVMGLQRVAEAANKDVLFMEVTVPPDLQIEKLEDFEEIKVSGFVVRRFNYTAYAQDHSYAKNK